MLVDDAGDAVVCATCGRALDGFDPDEDELGDAGQPICGECSRERDFIDFEVAMDEAGSDRHG
jgi:hypothetical protein